MAAAEDEDPTFDELAFLLGFGVGGVKLVNCCSLDLLVIGGIVVDWAGLVCSSAWFLT